MRSSGPDDTSGAVGLWIITGFLGSGKTTAINSLLAGRGNRTVGLLLNDFGPRAVDGSLIDAAAAGPDHCHTIVELNGGQIFCSCLSGQFVESIASIARCGVGTIVVESSGLALPRSLWDIIAETVHASDRRVRYSGMVAIVDAARFERLRTVVGAVDEQVACADLVLVNKTDLVPETRIPEIISTIERLNPRVRVIVGVNGALGWEDLPVGPLTAPAGGSFSFPGRSGSARPVTGLLQPPRSLSRAGVETLARYIGERSLRAKGYIRSPWGFWFVSLVGAQVEIREAAPFSSGPGIGLTVITESQEQMDEIQRHWSVRGTEGVPSGSDAGGAVLRRCDAGLPAERPREVAVIRDSNLRCD